jgi:hypothetical protein
MPPRLNSNRTIIMCRSDHVVPQFRVSYMVSQNVTHFVLLCSDNKHNQELNMNRNQERFMNPLVTIGRVRVIL